MADFKKLLSVQATTVEKPKPLPVGTYDAVITGHKFDESREKKTPYCRVTFRPVAPCGDVDGEAFEAFGGHANLSKKELFVDYWLTDEALFRFRQLFEEVLKLPVDGKTFDELAPQMDGQSVKVEIVHNPSQDGQQIYANAKRILSA